MNEPAVHSDAYGQPDRSASNSLASETRYHLVVLGLCTSVLVLSAVLTVRDSHVYTPLVNTPLPGICSFRALAGIDCPGCGLTRSFIRLARVDFVGAWHFNPAGILVFMVVAFQLPYRSFQLWLIGNSLPPRPWRQGVHFLWLVVAGLIVQWIYRLAQGGI